MRIQLSKKNANHPDCAFADSFSTVMCGTMISLTPCIAPICERECDLHEYAEFKSVEDMIEKLNDILSKPHGFPAIPLPRKDCHTLTFPPDKGHRQCVMCPEQDCEALVCMSDQNTSMVEALGLHDHPFWRERVEYFYKWFNKVLEDLQGCMDVGRLKEYFQIVCTSRLFQATSVCSSQSGRSSRSSRERPSMERHWRSRYQP